MRHRHKEWGKNVSRGSDFIKKEQNQISDKIIRILIFLFFMGMFLAGLAVTKDYGQHCDENNQFVLVHANMKEYMKQLAPKNWQAELMKWYDDRGIAEISASENQDHGIAVYYPMAPFLLTEQISHGLMLLLWNSYTFCLFFLGVTALYFIGKKLFLSRRAGLAAALLFYLTPRMFAEGHYNNKDVILLCLALASVWMGLEFVERKEYRYAVLMAVAAAFAANIKIVGAWPFGLMGIAYLWELTRKKEWNSRNFSVGLSAVIGFLVVYIAITPACWSNPAGFLAYLTGNAGHFARWDSEVLFDGILYKHSRNPLPRTYLIKMLGLTVPIYILVLWAVGQAAVIVRLCRERKKFFENEKNLLLLLFSLWWSVPLCFAMVSQMLVYNSWRHFYFCYGAIVLLAVHGLEELGRLAVWLAVKWKLLPGEDAAWHNGRKEKDICGTLVYGVLAFCLVFTAGQSIRNHPYEYAYFNAAAGRGIEEQYEIDYWVIGGKSILEELYACLEAAYDGGAENAENDGGMVKLSACDITTLIGMENGWVNLPPEMRTVISCTDNWQAADYVVVNSTYSVIEELCGNTDNRYVKENYEEICRISAYGNVIWTVYKR